MADYQLTDTNTVIRVADGASIPNDPANRDRVAFDAWVEAGGTPDPYVPPPAPPATISYALMRSRLTDAERQAILTACRTSWQMDDFVRLAQAEGVINLESDVTTAAKAALVGAGLLTAQRVNAVFAPAE